jgi:hypothetical protein
VARNDAPGSANAGYFVRDGKNDARHKSRQGENTF